MDTAMPFDELQPGLADHLRTICRAQMSGQYQPRMTYRPGEGLFADERTGKGEINLSKTVDRDDLRALDTAGHLDLVTARSHWTLTVTEKALAEFAQDPATEG